MHTLLTDLNIILKRSKRFIGLIAAIMGIFAIWPTTLLYILKSYQQKKIFGIQHASLRLLPGTDTLLGIAEGLNSLSPLEWIKGIRAGLIGTLVLLFHYNLLFSP